MVPRMVPSSVARVAITSTEREPTSTREKTSRPIWSVPNQCADDGPLLTASRSWLYGLWGAMCEPTSAHTTQNPTTSAPTRKVFERTSSCSSSRRICPEPASTTPATSAGAAVTRCRPAAAAG